MHQVVEAATVQPQTTCYAKCIEVSKRIRCDIIVSGAQEPRFVEVLTALATPAQMERIGKALTPIATHVSQ